jgi:hypothetical protein
MAGSVAPFQPLRTGKPRPCAGASFARLPESYFISAMHFLTKADFCSIGTFSRIARSSHARIFLALFRGNIFSGAVDFMLVASDGDENQSMQSARPIIAKNARRMAAPDRAAMIARFTARLQGLAGLGLGFAHAMQLEHGIDRIARRRRDAEFAAKGAHLARKPIELKPVAALEIVRH